MTPQPNLEWVDPQALAVTVAEPGKSEGTVSAVSSRPRKLTVRP